MSALGLKISTPIQPIPRGLGFYQVEEECLHVQIGIPTDSQRFFSYIDSPISRFDLDREGRLMFCDISMPKHQWRVVENLEKPLIIEPADIRWLTFRKIIETPQLFTNNNRSLLVIKLAEEEPHFNYYLAESVILQASPAGCACAIVINEILDDSAGRKISAFRNELRRNRPSSSPLRQIKGNSATVS